MRKFLKEHGYDTALALLVLLFGGSIVGLFQDVLSAFSAFPWAVVACCGLALVVGLGVSAITDRRAVKVAKVNQDGETERLKLRYDQELAARKREELEKARIESEEQENRIDNNLSMFISDQSWKRKALAVEIYSRERHRIVVSDRIAEVIKNIDVFPFSLQGMRVLFFEFDHRGLDHVIIKPTCWLIELFDERPEALNEFPDEAIEYAKSVIADGVDLPIYSD